MQTDLYPHSVDILICLICECECPTTLFVVCNRVQLFLPPATKLGQGYIFTGVCDSVHGGACMTCMPPPPADTTATAYGQ